MVLCLDVLGLVSALVWLSLFWFFYAMSVSFFVAILIIWHHFLVFRQCLKTFLYCCLYLRPRILTLCWHGHRNNATINLSVMMMTMMVTLLNLVVKIISAAIMCGSVV